MKLWQPIEWFIDVMQLMLSVEFFPGLSLGTISLGLLTIVLIFRMIIFPLTGGSVGSALTNAYKRSENYQYKQYKASRDKSRRFKDRYNRGD